MNGGGLCAVCGAPQGPYDPGIGLPRCRGELAHVMHYHVPIPLKARALAHAYGSDQEYPTADRPVSKRNPSWTY